MADSKYIKLDEAVEHRVYSREFKDYVVPVKQLKQLKAFEEPKEKDESEYYEKMLLPLFNRCWAQLGSRFLVSCLWCGLRSECEKRGIKGDSNGRLWVDQYKYTQTEKR